MTDSTVKALSVRVVFSPSSPLLKILVVVLLTFSMVALAALTWVKLTVQSQTEEIAAEAAAVAGQNRVLEQRVEQRLEGKYVAESQFGTFRQETGQAIAANSRAIEQQFTNVQQLDSAVEQLRSSVREVSATIRSGELADGVYGVEIGQQEGEDGVIRFRRYARLTAQKLSFYDSNDVEVAYISDRRLHITAADAAQITTQSLTAAQLQQGPYTWQLSADGHLSIR